MKVRRSSGKDISHIEKIYEAARAYMRESGNPTQWGYTYPEAALIEEDIKKGVSYVIVDENDRICGTFMFYVGDDPCYGRIVAINEEEHRAEGKWLNDNTYAVIHRIAGDGTTRGILKTALDYVSHFSDDIRMDTHRDNKTMQKALEKQGFVKCGIVWMEDGTERLAYHLISKREGVHYFLIDSFENETAKEVLSVYTKKYTENELRHLYEPDGGVFIAESPNVIERALAAGCEPLSFLIDEREWNDKVKKITDLCGQIPIFLAKDKVMEEITGLPMTRGMLSAMRRPILPTTDEICEKTSRVAVLYDVVNPTNVGAIFRSAAALNMDAVLLSADCSDPLYRRAIRVSMGTVFQIPWTFLQKGTELKTLKRLGFKTVAMALKDNSYEIDAPELKETEKLAVVLGTEGTGLPDDVIEECDYTVMIPMGHGVDSLNVAAASAVAFWELGKK